MIYTLFFMIFLNNFTPCLLCMHHTHPVLPHHLKLMENNTYSTINECNFTLVAPKKVINPYKQEIEKFVQLKPFGSFCVKCAACLAVADELAKIIKTTLEESENEQNSQDYTNEELSNRINYLCAKGFKNYDLRKYNESSLITNRLKCTEHINSKMDGSWTKKLRELCNMYTSHMDLEHISNDYINKTQKLTTDICSGTGIFRDCQNIETDVFTEILDEIECCEKCECKAK